MAKTQLDRIEEMLQQLISIHWSEWSARRDVSKGADGQKSGPSDRKLTKKQWREYWKRRFSELHLEKVNNRTPPAKKR